MESQAVTMGALETRSTEVRANMVSPLAAVRSLHIRHRRTIQKKKKNIVSPKSRRAYRAYWSRYLEQLITSTLVNNHDLLALLRSPVKCGLEDSVGLIASGMPPHCSLLGKTEHYKGAPGNSRTRHRRGGRESCLKERKCVAQRSRGYCCFYSRTCGTA
jgi:hypothetical protein